MFDVDFYEDKQGNQPVKEVLISLRDNKFILLHHFVKKTKKTPPKEIAQAKRNMKDFMERND